MANTIQLKRGTGSAVPSSLAEGELAINLDSGKLFYGSGSSVLSDFKVDTLTAETYVVSSSVTHMTTSFSSGSTAFGDSANDSHTFTGDITASGNISASGNVYAADYFDDGVNISSIYHPAIGNEDLTISMTDGLQDALNLKATIASPTFTGTVAGVTKTHVGLPNVTNESKSTMFASPTFTGTVAIPNIANVETAIAANTAKVTNSDQSQADINALDITEVGTISSGVWQGTTIKTAYIGDDQVTEDKLANTLLAEIDANTAKATNVSTNLTATTHASQITVNSSDGTNVVIAEASDTIAGLMTTTHHDKLDGIEASATADQTQADINGLAITTVGTLGSLTLGGTLTMDGEEIAMGGGEITTAISVQTGTLKGPTDGDLEISSDGMITFVLDDDNDETAQKFIFKNNSVEIATLNESGDLQLDGALIASRKYELPSSTVGDFKGGDIYYYGNGSTVKGGIYYIDGANWTLADADAEASTSGLLAVALGTDPDVDGMLLRGFVTLLTEVEGTEAIGSVLYLSATNSGKATVTAPGSGDFVRVLGYSLHATDNQVYFNPDNTWVQVA
jgi:hypothetical protein